MTSASRNIVALPRAQLRRHEHEVAFPPAALEITETPPSPIGRAIAASIRSSTKRRTLRYGRNWMPRTRQGGRQGW